MTTEPVTCPYCNALVTVAPGTAGGERVPCRRCGESFTLSPLAAPATTDIGTGPPAQAPAHAPDFSATRHWSIGRSPGADRRLALLILGVMACMAAGALAFALSTQSFRRDNDKGITQPHPKRRAPLDDDVTPGGAATPTPPAKLDALAWLPKDTNLIAAVHVREIAGSDAGKELLKQPIPVRVGDFKLAGNIESLLRALGFKSNEVDHLVIAVTTDVSLFPTLLVRTRQEYDEDDLRKRLSAERSGTAGGRTVYEFRAGDTFKSSACLLDSHTVAFSLVPGPLSNLPESPRAELAQLPRQLRQVLQKRVGPAGPFWIAGHSDDWSKTPARMLFAKVGKENGERLAKVRTFAAWVLLDDPALVRAEFNCGSDQAAKDLQKYLDIPDDAADWKAGRGDGWLSVQGRTKLDKVLGALER
jgi:hypothetical protein